MNVLVDNMAKVIASMRTPKGSLLGAPFFTYGHRKEMVARLSNKDRQKAKADKYPLFMLKLDTDEDVKGGLIHYDINMAIVYFSPGERFTDERYEKVIKPILLPLYEQFITEALPESGLFYWDDGEELPPHRKVDRPYWGTYTEEGNRNLFLDDPVDAIEILNLKISSDFKTC